VAKRIRLACTAAALVPLALLAAACSSSSSTPAASKSSPAAALNASGKSISETGSTLLFPLFGTWQTAYSTANPAVTITSGATGSGTGIADASEGLVNIGASDAYLSASDLEKYPGLLNIPLAVASVDVYYNLPNVKSVNLNGTVLAQIYSGKITTWNDPAIKALNPSASLPSSSINLEVRSDSSGTTANFSQYLVDAAGSAWTLGTASIVSFPKSAHANDGGSAVAKAVKATSNSIGYVDFSTASATGLTAASIKNSAGDYVAPSSASAAAAATHVTPKANLTFLTVDEPGATSYPITYQSWDLVYSVQPNATDVQLLQAYLGYLLGPGQALLAPLNLAPLPASIDSSAKAQLSKITS